MLAAVLPLLLSFYCAPDGARIPPGTQPQSMATSVWNPGSKTVSLPAARGETVAFQLVVKAEGAAPPAAAGAGAPPPGTPLELAIIAEPLKAASGARLDPAVFREQPIAVTTRRRALPGKLPGGPSRLYRDALLPPDGAIMVPPGGDEAIWIDIPVPRDAAPGDYHGFVVLAAGGESDTARVDVRVGTATLAVPSIPFIAGWWLDRLPDRDDWRRSYDLAAAHGLTLALRRGLEPRPAFDAGGRLAKVDWTRYDAEFGSLIATAPRWQLPVAPWFHVPFRTVGDSAAVASWFAEVAGHWRQKGWPLDRAFAWVYDEPRIHGLDFPRELVRYAAVVRRAAPGVNILLTDAVEDSAALPACDWLASSGSRYYPPEMNGLRKSGRIRQAWFYQGSEPALPLATIDAASPGLRAWPWIARRYGVDAMLYWSANFWAKGDTVVANTRVARAFVIPDGQPATYGDGEGTLLYPGAFASVRLKQLRRGMEDLALMEAADRAGHGAQVDSLVRAMIPSALAAEHGVNPFPGGSHYMPSRADSRWSDRLPEWTRDPDAWERARRRLLALAG